MKIPKELIGILAPYYPGLDLRRVEVIQGIPDKIRRLVRSKNPASVSVGYRIYVDPSYIRRDDELPLRIILHELRHAQQFAKFGKIMYRNYLIQVRKHGYWGSRIERDARRHEERVLRELKRRGLYRRVLTLVQKMFYSPNRQT